MPALHMKKKGHDKIPFREALSARKCEKLPSRVLLHRTKHNEETTGCLPVEKRCATVPHRVRRNVTESDGCPFSEEKDTLSIFAHTSYCKYEQKNHARFK